MRLGVKNLTPHHTIGNISDDLREMIDGFNIKKERIVAATTDNAANIVGATKSLLSDGGERNVHVPCFAHNINLVVAKGLGLITDFVAIIEKVKTIVAYFKRSNVTMDYLRDEQKKEGKTDGTFLYLIQEVSTRWNSTFYCLERFILLSAHVGKILLSPRLQAPPNMLTPFELAIAEECLTLLRPFKAATKEISGEKYVSGSLVIPLINCITTSLSRTCVSSKIAHDLKKSLEAQVQKRFTPMEKITLIAIATILDPRFKKIHFISPHNLAAAISILKDEVKVELR